LTLIVVSGAPGTGKSTVAAALGAALRFPVLSLDPVKEALDPRLASDRAKARIGHGRHPIHRDVINPAMAGQPATLAATVTPLRLGAALVEVDTGRPGAAGPAVAEVRAALG
jgi:predicted ABC-type ATPase